MSKTWREPIFDRTWEDVEFAKTKIAEWIAYNISSAEYDEKVRIENEELILKEGRIERVDNDLLKLDGDGRAIVEDDVLIVKIGVVYDLKGCLNTIDINRIEDNIAFLSEKLMGLGYISNVSTKQWRKDNLPTGSDIIRIVDNVRSLISSFYQVDYAPALPPNIANHSFLSINQIERNIDLIKYLLDCMVNSFRKSGALKSGATMILPTRR